MALCNVLLSTPNSRLIQGTRRPPSSNPCACANTSGVSFQPRLRGAGLKKAPAPCSRNRFTQRLTVTSGTPNASAICLWLAVPLTIN
jgi:hypothetical protein